ncbi:MAG TPA: HlyD family efflux transporter periplasmic adaptor subunit [Planctomycetaceae bacterium]|nr:HlyD family efflux transporter periplasmic adaptor subunit [Planctomycetaceae bacterium]
MASNSPSQPLDLSTTPEKVPGSPSFGPDISQSRPSRGASRFLLPLLLLVAVGAGAVYAFPALKEKFFSPKAAVRNYVTKPAVMGPFQIKVVAKGTIDSSRNASLVSNVEGSTTIISIVPAGSLVVDPLTAKVSGEVKEIRNVTSGTAVVVIEDQNGELVEHPYELSEFSAVVVKAPETVKKLDENGKLVDRIVPGTQVKAGQILIGDLVCELDSAPLVDQEKQQQIAVEQGSADLEKAVKNVEIQVLQNQSDLSAASLAMDLAKLDLEKYIEGEYPQAMEKVEGEIYQSTEEWKRAEDQYEFTKRLASKGYKTPEDIEADRINVSKTKLLRDVKLTEKKVLEKFIKVRTTKELEELETETARGFQRVELAGKAALAQFRAEVTAAELAYTVQKTKLDELRRQIIACKLIAPQAGRVVYANENSRRSEPVVIEEGAAVRERQKLINLPDLTAMKVDARIHESKISNIVAGLPVQIRVDAIPNHVYAGKLEAVSAVPLAGSWPNTDLKEYEASVRITDTGEKLNELKPGMTANIDIIVENSRENLLQIPVQATVRIGRDYYVWVLDSKGHAEKRKPKLGRSNDVDFVVEDGIQEGELVVMNPLTQFSDEIKELNDQADNDDLKNQPKIDNPGPQDLDKPTPGPGPEAGGPVAGAPRGGNDPTAFFKRMDKNGDGKLSDDELPEQMKARFAGADTDKDGSISLTEFQAVPRPPGGGRPGGPGAGGTPSGNAGPGGGSGGERPAGGGAANE